MRIALLEDNAEQSDLLKLWLESAGHQCLSCDLGKNFIRQISRESFDLFVLDWDLPDLSGVEVLEWMRSNIGPAVPVLFVTAHSAEQDIVLALEKGADDYMTKPVRKNELIARVSALQRRAKGDAAGAGVLEFGKYRIDCDKRAISDDSRPVELTPKEFELALFLFSNIGRLLSRGHLLDSIWGRNEEVNTRTVDTHVSRLRKKLNLEAERGWRLTSVYQYGYRLEKLSPPAN